MTSHRETCMKRRVSTAVHDRVVPTTMGRRIVAFDVFGTSFGFTNVVREIERQFGDELKRASTSAEAVLFTWYGGREWGSSSAF
jgi:hypothetical protein